MKAFEDPTLNPVLWAGLKEQDLTEALEIIKLDDIEKKILDCILDDDFCTQTGRINVSKIMRELDITKRFYEFALASLASKIEKII